MTDQVDQASSASGDPGEHDGHGQLGRWLTLLVVLIVVTIGSITTASLPVPPGTNFVGLTASEARHLLAYAGLAGTLASIDTGPSPTDNRTLRLGIVFCLVVGFGAALELVQSLLSSRTESLGDLVVNVAGAGLGLVGYELRGRVRYRWR